MYTFLTEKNNVDKHYISYFIKMAVENHRLLVEETCSELDPKVKACTARFRQFNGANYNMTDAMRFGRSQQCDKVKLEALMHGDRIWTQKHSEKAWEESKDTVSRYERGIHKIHELRKGAPRNLNEG